LSGLIFQLDLVQDSTYVTDSSKTICCAAAISAVFALCRYDTACVVMSVSWMLVNCSVVDIGIAVRVVQQAVSEMLDCVDVLDAAEAEAASSASPARRPHR